MPRMAMLHKTGLSSSAQPSSLYCVEYRCRKLMKKAAKESESTWLEVSGVPWAGAGGPKENRNINEQERLACRTSPLRVLRSSERLETRRQFGSDWTASACDKRRACIAYRLISDSIQMLGKRSRGSSSMSKAVWC